MDETPVNQLPPGVMTGCFSAGTPNYRLMLIFWGVLTTFQAIYVAISMVKYWEFSRQFGFSLSPLLHVFFRDGVGYFLIILAVNLLNTLLEIFGPVELQESGNSWLFAIASITVCRLVLNLRHAATAPKRVGIATGSEFQVMKFVQLEDIEDSEETDLDCVQVGGLPK